MAVAVTDDLGIDRVSQNLLIANGPFKTVGGEEGNCLRAHCHFRRPAPPGAAAKKHPVLAFGHGQLFTGILRILKAARQRQPRAGPQGAAAVDEQRHDGVIEGGGHDLDLPPLLQAAVQGDDPGKQLALLLHHQVLLRFAKIAPLFNETAQRGIGAADFGIYPGQVKPDLQVAIILEAVAIQGRPHRARLADPPLQLQQLQVAGLLPNHLIPVNIKIVLEQVLFLLIIKFLRRLVYLLIKIFSS